MHLFDFPFDKAKNYLPEDGTVNYYGKLCTSKEANEYYGKLMNHIEWRNDEAIIFGKKIVTKRKVAWYGDLPYEYTYSNITKRALPWTLDLLHIKSVVEKEGNEQFNSCLLNLYHEGAEGMAWHSDVEKDLKQNGAIASVSFGYIDCHRPKRSSFLVSTLLSEQLFVSKKCSSILEIIC